MSALSIDPDTVHRLQNENHFVVAALSRVSFLAPEMVGRLSTNKSNICFYPRVKFQV